jgi:hypothetical protein
MEAMTWSDTAWRVLVAGFLAASPGVAILLLATTLYLMARPLIRRLVPLDPDGAAGSKANPESEISCQWQR